MADLGSFLSEIEELEMAPDAEEASAPAAAQPATATTAAPVRQVEVIASSVPALNPKYLEALAAPFQPQSDVTSSAPREKDRRAAAPKRVYKEPAPEEVVYAIRGAPVEKEIEAVKKHKVLRAGAGEVWEDKKLEEWPEGDYRLFVGNLAGEVRDDLLSETFSEYKSMHRVRVIRDAKTDQSKGFGFVGFLDPFEMLKALREKQGKLCGSRPMQIKQAKMEERDAKVVRQRKKEKEREERKVAKLGTSG